MIIDVCIYIISCVLLCNDFIIIIYVLSLFKIFRIEIILHAKTGGQRPLLPVLLPFQQLSGSGVGNHAAGAHDLGQITSRYHLGIEPHKLEIWPRGTPWTPWTLEVSRVAWLLGFLGNKKCQREKYGKIERHFKLGLSRGLIVDATLEASGAPIHELNGALGLDGCNSRVHILWHHIS